jgi:hypothetical protein
MPVLEGAPTGRRATFMVKDFPGSSPGLPSDLLNQPRRRTRTPTLLVNLQKPTDAGVVGRTGRMIKQLGA